MTVVQIETLAPRDLQATRIYPQQLVDGCVQVSDVVRMFDGVETQFIRCTVNSRLNASSREPDRETMWMMISSSGRLIKHAIFDARRATKLGGKHH